jgi:hypothetical protein
MVFSAGTVMVLALLITGCAGDTTAPPGGGGPNPVVLTGTWNGTWFVGSFSGYVSLSLAQHADSIAGEASIGGIACVPSGDVSGTVTADSVFITISSGGDSLFIATSPNSQSLQGTIKRGVGVCAGISGTIGVEKKGVFVETVASQIQFIPSTYSTAYPTRAHMVVGGSDVFWYDGEAKAVMKASASGDPAQTLASGFTSDFVPLAVDDNNVYVADHWTVKKVSRGGGTADSLAQANFYLWDIATDGAYVYWIDNQPLAQVQRVPVAGGAVQTIGSGDKAGRIRVVDGYVYWMSHDDTILRVASSGGVVETVADNLPFLSDIACNGQFVFFSEQDNGWIYKVPVGGGAVTWVVMGTSLWAPYMLAINDVGLSWINQAEVAALPILENMPQQLVFNLAVDPSFPEAIAVDQDTVYWSETINGAIRRSVIQ